jgi:bifunctional isochorismate lyase/aryl carrier protein
MSSGYFTRETIDAKAQEMFERLQFFRIKSKIRFHPEEAALLIIDMQRYFIEEESHAGLPSAGPIIPRIRKLAEAFQEARLPVILTRHLNTQQDANMLAQWWADVITEESELSEIDPELNLPDATVIIKTQYDAFYQTALENILREKGVSQLVITGVMTHLCCETTARSAFVRGFKVFFPIDGTATNDENHHWGTLLNLSHGFALPVLMKEIQTSLEVYSSGRT